MASAEAPNLTPTPEQAPDAAANAAAVEQPVRAPFWKRLPRPAGLISSLGNSPHRVAIVAVALAAVVGVVCYVTLERGPTPVEQYRSALALLEDRDNIKARHKARALARQLERMEFRHPDFAGATEFVLGIVAFRDARSLTDKDQLKQYQVAVHYLTEAGLHEVDDEHKPEWSFALGVSLHEAGSPSDALVLLAESVKHFPSGRVEAAMRFVDICLDLKSPERLEEALEFSNALVRTEVLSRAERDRIYLQRSQLLLALGKNAEAEQALAQVSQETSGRHGATVFRGQTLMLEGRYEEALAMLRPVASEAGLERTYPRQASYMMGLCAMALGKSAAANGSWRQQAIEFFKQTVRDSEATHEGVAANLYVGDLLRATGAHEEALLAYHRALVQVREPDAFRNRWLTLQQFRETIRTAWLEWVGGGEYQFAIELAQMMPPLFSEHDAFTLAARAHEQWAERLQAELDKATFTQWQLKSAELRTRWQLSGKAYAALADASKATSDYPGYLWTSTDHYRNGHDFENALVQLDRFIKLQQKDLLPAAFVRRGEILIDLNRSRDDLTAALEHFQGVIDGYPTSPVAYEAQYCVGTCRLELDQPHLARKAWEEMISSGTLTPAAREWRMALFSLGRLLYQLGEARKGERDAAEGAPQSRKIPDECFEFWKQAVLRLEEFIERYPQDPQAPEAHFLLARSLRESARLPLQKLAGAETEKARAELTTSMESLLREAIKNFRPLQAELVQRGEVDRLDELGQQMLRDCCFEIAHAYYALGDYDEAVIAYSGAVNRYAQDPRILLAYIQMSNCYEHLGKDVEARSMIEQARVIHRQLPADAFERHGDKIGAQGWEAWLDWARALRQPAATTDDNT